MPMLTAFVFGMRPGPMRHVIAQHLAQRLVQQVGGRMVAADVGAARVVDRGAKIMNGPKRHRDVEHAE